IAGPRAERLRREAPTALVEVAGRERERQADERRQPDGDERENRRAEPPRAEGGEEAEHEERERDVDGVCEVERPVVATRPLDLLTRENRIVQLDRTRLLYENLGGRGTTAESDPALARQRVAERALARVAPADPGRDADRDPDEPLGLLLVPPPQRLGRLLVARRHLLHDRRV